MLFLVTQTDLLFTCYMNWFAQSAFPRQLNFNTKILTLLIVLEVEAIRSRENHLVLIYINHLVLIYINHLVLIYI